MGSKSGGGARTPYEAPNTLSSAQLVRLIDMISEGVVSGFAHGDDDPFKSVYFNDTPVQNADGSYNFKGVQGVFQRGLPDQSYVPGFETTERTVPVSTEVKHGTPVIRAVTDDLIGRLRVTVGVQRNVSVQDNGDSLPATTSMLVELIGATTESQAVTFTEKGSGAYYEDVVFERLPAVPFNLRVSRVSPDATTDKLQNNTFFASYVEMIDAKLSYPHTALAYLKIDSDQFGNQIPRRNYLLKGKVLQVPSNYNPETRAYSGIWDGSFKADWSNNPAWVFYDLLTQPRYSTLARRLNIADVDKWSLYAIARYCDELVDDGFGGKEPRFVCNAYITEARQAGELLTDLASVFRGLPIWNGAQISVVMDSNSDPIASYNNSNVVDGIFTYAGVSLKSIHTAVNVQYLDKYDGYRAKTEYVSDDALIARYGLNIKSVVAFGCDSRGQAARFGAWTLATEAKQQSSVTFSVARDGLKHLPYDIIQVADNDYAGAQIGGRIVSVSGSLMTLDREIDNAVGATLHLTGKSGVSAHQIMAQPAANQVTLENAPADAADVWVLANKVKPRLYRAIAIKENTDEGTYTISAIAHDVSKYAEVDSYASFAREINTLHTVEPVVFNPDHRVDGDAVVVTWDNLASAGDALSYDIEVHRDGKLYRHIPDAQTPEIRLEGLPEGYYTVKVRARNARGQLSAPITRTFAINYDITGFKTTPQMFAVKLTWTSPEIVISKAHTEIWYGKTDDINAARKLVSLPYPQNSYTLQGVEIADTYYFWARLVDDRGITGKYTASVMGQCDRDPAPIIAQITGAITESTLAKSLLESLDGKIAAGDTAVVGKLNDKAAELGTKITAVENVNTTQSQQIVTVTAAQNGLTAGLETEKQARIAGDEAEALARQTLAARVTGAEGGISTLNQTVAQHGSVISNQETLITAKLDSKLAALDLSEQVTTTLDLRDAKYNTDSFYRVKIPLGNKHRYIFKLHQNTDAPQTGIPWATHASGSFYLNLTWTVIPVSSSGNKADQAEQFAYAHCKLDCMPVFLGGQDDGADTFYVRGGGLYLLRHDKDLVPSIASSDGIFKGYLDDPRTVRSVNETMLQYNKPVIERVTSVESSIRTVNDTVASHNQATAAQITTIRAELAAKQVSGNLIDTSMWARGYTLQSPVTYNGAASQTAFVDADTPLGTRKPVMQMTADSTGQANGGFNALGQNVAIDPSKIYRYAILARRISGSANIYWGAGTGRVCNLNTATANPNPYFASTNGLRLGVWYLFVGYVYPVGSTGYTTDGAGIWDLSTGKKVVNGNNYTRHASYPDVSCRAYQYYASAGAVAQFSDPMVHEINGNEPNLQSLIEAGKVQATWSLKVEAIANGRKAVAGLALGADGVTGDTQFLVRADKFALVNQNSTGQIKTPFAVVTENGATKMALVGDMIASGTILGKHIAGSQTISAPNISGGNITGGKITGTEISGATISGGVIKGGRIEGAVIVGGRIEGVDGVFSGKVYIEHIVGGKLSDAATIIATKWKSTGLDGSSHIQRYLHWYRRQFIVDASPATRLLSMEYIKIPMLTESGISGGGITCTSHNGLNFPVFGSVTLAPNITYTFTVIVKIVAISNEDIAKLPKNIPFKFNYMALPSNTGQTIRQI